VGSGQCADLDSFPLKFSAFRRFLIGGTSLTREFGVPAFAVLALFNWNVADRPPTRVPAFSLTPKIRLMQPRKPVIAIVLVLLAGLGEGSRVGHALDLPKPPAPAQLVVWPASLMQVRIASDKPFDPKRVSSLVGKEIRFQTGLRNLAPTEREAVQPEADRSGLLNVTAATLDALGRTLTLTTDPHPTESVYQLGSGQLLGREGPLRYDLSGVSVGWTPEGATEQAWSGWLPNFDPSAFEGLARVSPDHEAGLRNILNGGQVSLESLVRLPQGKSILNIECSEPLEATLDGEPPASSKPTSARFEIDSEGGVRDLYLVIQAKPAKKVFNLTVKVREERAVADQPLARAALILPWVPPSTPEGSATRQPPPFALAAGDPQRGRVAFQGERAKCSTCHRVDGIGGEVGPDLSQLQDRSLETLYQDISEPSASIHPDFTSFTVALKDGRVMAGVVRAKGAKELRLVDSDAKVSEFPRSEVEDLRPTGTSMMPVGLAGSLGEEEIRDLLAFLRSAPAARKAPSTR